MIKIFMIGLAGFVGTVGRFWLSDVMARKIGETFPWGTLAVNLIGCFLAGLLFYPMHERYAVSPNVRSIVLIGFLGGFTTFSSFGLQTFALLKDNQFALATANIAVSNILGLLLVWAGYALAKAI
jgi:fluoride exporter